MLRRYVSIASALFLSASYIHTFEAQELELSDYKLEMVNVICRHGARTPITIIPWMNWSKEEFRKKTGIEYENPGWKCARQVFMLMPFMNHQDRLSQGEKNFLDIMHAKEYEYGKQILNGNCAPGMLTTVGAIQMMEFGRKLRKEYIEKRAFLNEKYSSEEIYVRSTDIERTLETAMSIMMGMFPPGTRDGHIIPIHTNHYSTETMYPPTRRHCKRLKQLMEQMKKTEEYKNIVEQMKKPLRKKLERLLNYDLYNNQSEKLDATATNRDSEKIKVPDPEGWHNTIQCYIENNVPLPEFVTPSLIKEIEELATRSFGYEWTWSKEMTRLGIGRFVHDLHVHIEDFLNKKHKHKFNLFTGHDSTLVPLMSAFGVYDNTFPPVGSRVVIEILSRDGEYFVRMTFNEKDLKLPNCNVITLKNGEILCPYNDFKRIAMSVGYNQEQWKQACDYEEIIPKQVTGHTCNIPKENVGSN